MQQQSGSSNSQTRFHPVQLTEMALRSAGHLYDMNVSAARVWMQTQARAAAAFGLPDWSPLFDQADQRARNVFSNGAEQVLHTAQRANDAARELQRQVGRVIETQTTQAAETWQRGIEELTHHTAESLDQMCETARKTAEDAERNAQTLGQELRNTVRQAGDQARQQTAYAADRTQQASQQSSQAMQQGAQQGAQAAGQASQSADEARSEQKGRQRAGA